jgi:hypothetical protein
MMSKRNLRTSRRAGASDLKLHVTEFLGMIAKAGYAEYTHQDKRRALVPFIRWVHDAGISIKDLDRSTREK